MAKVVPRTQGDFQLIWGGSPTADITYDRTDPNFNPADVATAILTELTMIAPVGETPINFNGGL